MSATVLYMSMSLDGFIAGPNEGPDNGLGDGGTVCTSGSGRMPTTTKESPAVRLASMARSSTR
jgi:hypothetical protein